MTTSHRLASLERLPLFSRLTAAARRAVAAGGTWRDFDPGETLWTAGAEPRGLYVIVTGEVRIVRAPRGRQYAVHVERGGATLGEVPLFAGGHYPATAIAAERTVCFVIGRAALARAVSADPDLAFRLLAGLATRVRGLVERLDARSSTTVAQRLASFVLARHLASRGRAFVLGTTQAEAAEEIGTVREVLVRELGALRHARVVGGVARGTYRVLDERRLRRIIEG
ncbi:MAG: Crp/Fnr family transcriptional regulator [Gemmatimonadaceae bacterium]|nr:Crp/Fnr family transcriptional regulator [Gemmatimonadaceae bacterium]